mmetsp:Transcript_53524/g.122045  ORF Transcript_53524/g.122045 Transcript_53524/m.122045 type:complete len:213 (+) Transcript_53524:332-970(+)
MPRKLRWVKVRISMGSSELRMALASSGIPTGLKCLPFTIFSWLFTSMRWMDLPLGLKPTSRTIPRKICRNSIMASSSIEYTSVSTKNTGTMRWCGIDTSCLMRSGMTRCPALWQYMMARGRSVATVESIRPRTPRSRRSHCRYSLIHSALSSPSVVVGTRGTRKPRVSMNRSPLLKMQWVSCSVPGTVWLVWADGSWVRFRINVDFPLPVSP